MGGRASWLLCPSWVPAQTLTRGPTEAEGAGDGECKGGGWRADPIWGPPLHNASPESEEAEHPAKRRWAGARPAALCVRPPSSGPTQLYTHPGSRAQGLQPHRLTLVGDHGTLLPRTLAVCGTGPGTGRRFC